ncbi:uncharacterized protein GGS25DRAFT_265877 [Hypoxylon fragiforme]|uniref:uncharacterized protein n=1 Tax=Hypoxylon fragiforme TaxID=63214 RepID=UPI0020C6F6F2|nr:uncharacterized protein GGS25DRAFT_265877 [Hypoxylon fragiforme]KAI2608228.1 hypothetical protein GGS25DRAFT_265877 [Hypoxylon fragiforme]
MRLHKFHSTKALEAMPLRIPFFNLLQRRDLPHNPSRRPHRHAPRRHIPRDHRARRNRAPLAHRNPRQNNHMPADPAIVANRDRPRILDIVPPALDLRLVRRGQNRHVRAEHDAVADGHERAVEDRQVVVGVEAVAEADVAAVVDGEGRLDEDLVADAPEELRKQPLPPALQVLEPGFRVGREECVVLVHPAPRGEADPH